MKVTGLIIAICVMAAPAAATWRPEYAKSPPSVQQWFKDAPVTAVGQRRLGFKNCCDQSDRFDTQFRVDRASAGDSWYFRDDKGNWQRIPDDVIHDDEIHAAKAEDDALPEFEQMRREGVLFIYGGRPTCFWPPQGAG
jgi:hypothetical protein